MKSKKIIIQIDKPVSEIFQFLINHINTPKWIDSFIVEQTNEWPVRIGTVYKNQNKNGVWQEYIVSEFKENEMFVFAQKDGNYHVKYTFKPIGKENTELRQSITG